MIAVYCSQGCLQIIQIYNEFKYNKAVGLK